MLLLKGMVLLERTFLSQPDNSPLIRRLLFLRGLLEDGERRLPITDVVFGCIVVRGKSVISGAHEKLVKPFRVD